MIRRWLFGARGGRRHHNRRARKQFFCRLRTESLEERRLLAVADHGVAGDGGQLVVDGTQSPTSLIVQFKPGANFASSLSAYSYGSSLSESWDLVPDLRLVKLNAGVDVEEALAAYGNDSNVVHAEPDYRVKLTDFSVPPSDEHYNEQWDLRNTGQQGGFVGSDIHMEDAWNAIQGQSLNPVVVAVIDTGVDYTHPELAPVMWTNAGETPDDHIDNDHDGYVDDVYGYNFADNNGDPMDDFFHGTHVAGTIAAVQDNGIGIAGIATNVQIMAVKFLDDTGSGVESDAIRALNYAVARGAKISNNSWGGLPFSSAFQTALTNAAKAGHIFVAAAGNNGSNNDNQPFYPASYSNSNVSLDNVVSVAATDAGDALAYFSNYGKKSVDIGAPGFNIFSTLPTNGTQGMQDEGLIPYYGVLSGTSMAAPHVAAVLAMVWGLHPEMSMRDVIDDVLNNGDAISSLSPMIKTGKRLDAAKALGVTPTDSIAPSFVLGDPGGIVEGPIDHVRIKFTEPMNPDSFGPEDIVGFYGPNGDVWSNGPFGPAYAVAVTPVNDDYTTFDILFDTQVDPGGYTMIVGPHITDPWGNEVDQNGDRTTDDNDNFQVSFSILEPGSTVGPYSSIDVPVSISGFSIFTSILTINEDIPIADLNVVLNLSYPRDGNLNIWLVSPSQVSVMLSQRHGGSGRDFNDTIFDDQADTSIAMGAAPFPGAYQPDEALAVFNSTSAMGTWQLNIQNASSRSRQGTLNSWSLDITPGDTSTGGGGDGGGDGGDDGTQNDPPIPQDDFITGYQGQSVVIATGDLLANDSDPNSDSLSVYSVTNPIGGSVELAGDTITFSPIFGSMYPCSFEYTVFDGYNISIATVHISIEPYYDSYDFHNYRDPNDVDNDGFVAAMDVISIINFINANPGSTNLGGGGKIFPASKPIGYPDVIADNKIAANDVLNVINHINSRPHSTSLSTNGTAGDNGLSPAAVDAYLLSSTLDGAQNNKKK